MVAGDRGLRVLCTFHGLEGCVPGWKPGDHLLLFLSFNLGEAPVEGLMTTRRGVTEQGELVDGGRLYGFHADGWNAQLYSSRPLHREVELTGYFTHSTHSSFDVPTYAVVTAVYQHDSDTIIDVTLDGAIPPPLQDPSDGQVICDGSTLWIIESPLPFLRGFSVSTGELVEEISVPTWDPLIRVGDDLVSDRIHSWRLPDLEPVKIGSPPEVPEGWEIIRDFGNGLCSLIQAIEATVGDYSSYSLMQVGNPPCLLDFDLGRYEVNGAYRFGDKIHVSTWKHHLVLAADFTVLETDIKEDLLLMYTPLTTATGLSSGRTVGPYVVFREPDGLTFHDAVTTEKITELSQPEKAWMKVAHASEERIVVILHRNTVHAIAVWEPDSGWRECKLLRPSS